MSVHSANLFQILEQMRMMIGPWPSDQSMIRVSNLENAARHIIYLENRLQNLWVSFKRNPEPLQIRSKRAYSKKFKRKTA